MESVGACLRDRFRAFPLDGALLFFQPSSGVSIREPARAGAACDGSPVGQCSKGATCDFDICQEFCDSTAADPCPSGGTCIVEEWFPPGTVGVCVD